MLAHTLPDILATGVCYVWRAAPAAAGGGQQLERCAAIGYGQVLQMEVSSCWECLDSCSIWRCAAVGNNWKGTAAAGVHLCGKIYGGQQLEVCAAVGNF